jgi:hypothetical protein
MFCALCLLTEDDDTMMPRTAPLQSIDERGGPVGAGGGQRGCTLGALVCLSLALGCAFGGYVPQERVAPTSEVGRQIVNLGMGTRVTSELDCPSGQCRLRYRVLVDRPGILTVQAWGPVGRGPEAGPRLAQLVIEGPAQNVLGVVYADSESPLTVEAHVQPGLHFILVQGLGGHLIYDLSANVSSSGAVAMTEQAQRPPVSDTLPPPQVPRNQPRGSIAQNDVSDGADFAYDPRVEIKGYRRYAFAQDPQAVLEGVAPPDGSNPFIERQVQREVRYYVADLGFVQTPHEEAELLFSVHVGSRSTTWFSMGPTLYNRSYDSYFDSWRGHGAYIRQHTYVDGTLVIDVIDTNTGDLVWHGWTTEPIALGEDTNQVIKQAVKSVLDQLGSS